VPEAAVQFTAVLPIKSWTHAKSRLHEDPIVRHAFARALLKDTLAAVLDAGIVVRTVVVTPDAGVAEYARFVGAEVVADRTRARGDALNDAVARGADWARKRFPRRPIAVLPGDLPALTGPDLSGVLRSAAVHDLAFCPDAAGHGTTLVVARTPALLRTAYGPDSARRHRELGAVEMADVPPGVRRDIDVLGDLAGARDIGLGRNTSQVVEDFGAELDAFVQPAS
jgi:2-phospho-L-lactate guanylyltransferase